jgi:hypothetical protein
MVQMLLDGELDAAVVGGPDLKDSRLQPVIANPIEAAQAWCKKQSALPINHMVVVKESLAQANPDAVKKVFRLLRESKTGRAGARRRRSVAIRIRQRPAQPGVDYRLFRATEVDCAKVCRGRAVQCSDH